LIMNVNGPGKAVAGRTTFTVEDCPALSVPPAGIKEHVWFAGAEELKLVQLRVIEPENVPVGAAVTVKLAVWPARAL